MRRDFLALTAVLSASVSANSISAQTLAQRVDAVRDGRVLMAFQARPGVCGGSNGSIWTRESWKSSSWNQNDCLTGPVRVSLGRAEGTTISVRVFVGGVWRATAGETDIGVIPQQKRRTISPVSLTRSVVEVAATRSPPWRWPTHRT